MMSKRTNLKNTSIIFLLFGIGWFVSGTILLISTETTLILTIGYFSMWFIGIMFLQVSSSYYRKMMVCNDD
jgi:hypothetical protein